MAGVKTLRTCSFGKVPLQKKSSLKRFSLLKVKHEIASKANTNPIVA